MCDKRRHTGNHQYTPVPSIVRFLLGHHHVQEPDRTLLSLVSDSSLVLRCVHDFNAVFAHLREQEFRFSKVVGAKKSIIESQGLDGRPVILYWLFSWFNDCKSGRQCHGCESRLISDLKIRIMPMLRNSSKKGTRRCRGKRAYLGDICNIHQNFQHCWNINCRQEQAVVVSA